MGRHDLEGFFWQDTERVSRQGQRSDIVRPLPPIPDTGWQPPTDFPRLDAAKVIALDCETYDPNLFTTGPSVRTGGYIVGLAVGTDDGGRWYFPMRHAVQPELNLPPANVLRWARDTFANPNQPKCGANLLYDLDFLAGAGVPVAGKILDVQIAEPLLDENARSYSLEALAVKYLGEHKVDEALYRWCHLAYGGKEGRSQAGNIWRAPPSLVGPYAEGDVDLPLRIFALQEPLLAAQELTAIFDIERRLVPMLLAMRQRGVRVDLEGAQRVYDMLTGRIEEVEKRLGGMNVYAADDISRYCKKHNIEVALTERGNPSFTAGWLERHPDPLIRSISEARKWYKARDTFVKGYVLDMQVNGRIHAQFNQLRSDDTGAVSGRFSSSQPNLQNIPARDPEIGPLMRGLFLPDEGGQWAKLDWSQIEFRYLCHYGQGEGASTARRMYREDPKTDFHRWAAELVWPGQPEMRKPAKNINFGLVYGMGEAHMAEVLGRSLEDIKPLFDTYHTALPFIRNTYNEVSKKAAQRGYIRTFGGRRRRFEDWELASWGERSKTWPSEAEARAANPRKNVRRAFTHKALNALLQGSAADAMKTAMAVLWESGVCDVLGPPLLTVHDELDWSVPIGYEYALREVQHIMETCVKLKVPLLASLEVGRNWADLREV